MDEFLEVGWPAPAHVATLITTRLGGVSEERYGSFNLGDHVGDRPDHVRENRARLRHRLPSEPVWLEQVHQTQVVHADRVTSGVRADAAVTRSRQVVCAVLTADCLPLLLCDQAGQVVGVAHAGWRGLAAGVIETCVREMAVDAGRLLAYLGPAIGARSYEIGADVRDAFLRHDPASEIAFVGSRPGHWYCDLYALARLRLAACGVSQIFGGHCDTAAEPDRFYSYRRDGVTGRMATLIWLWDSAL